MELLSASICALIGFAANYFLIPIIRKVSLAAESNKPQSFHHTHSIPIPRYGGLALAISFVLIALFASYALRGFPSTSSLGSQAVIILGALAMFSLGFADDLFHLGAKRKLLFQILIATTVYHFGIQIDRFHVPIWGQTVDLGIWSGFVTVAWLVAITNLINLIDGIDGLAGGVSLMLMCLLAYVGWGDANGFSSLIAVGMAGALLGFLKHNFPPATIYMGDGGAYFLGFLIAILSVVNSHKGTVAAALTAPLIALALPIVDVSWAIIRRGLKGLPIFRPDKQHIHHRLSEFGFSSRKTVLTLYTVSSLFLFMAFVAFWSQGKMIPIIFGLLFLVLLISARSFGFIEDWWSIGKQVGNSLELRKETRYALNLSRWLQMEAERVESVEALWNDFQFLLQKFGFTSAELFLHDKKCTWKATEFTFEQEPQTSTHSFNIDGKITLNLIATGGWMNAAQFELMSELAAEALFKSLSTWKKLHEIPLAFGSTVAESPRKVLTKRQRSYVGSRSSADVGI